MVVVVPVGAGGIVGAVWVDAMVVVVVVALGGIPPVGMPGMVVPVPSTAGTEETRRADAAANGESTPPTSNAPNTTLVAPQRMGVTILLPVRAS